MRNQIIGVVQVGGIRYDVAMNEAEKLLEEERLILAATELVVAAMAEQGVTRTELAKRMGTSKGNISQFLSGERNLTLRSFAQMLFQLGLRAKITEEEIQA